MKYKISIDSKKCIGCGSCVAICEKVFELKNGKAVVKKKESDEKCVKEAADLCPVQAIKIIKI
jgi:ferredoxin